MTIQFDHLRHDDDEHHLPGIRTATRLVLNAIAEEFGIEEPADDTAQQTAIGHLYRCWSQFGHSTAEALTMAQYLKNAEQSLSTSYRIDPLAVLQTEQPPLYWGNRLTSGGVTVLHSKGGRGKGFVSMQLCRAFAEGTSVDTHSDPVPQGRAMYLSVEDSESVVSARIVGTGITPDALDNVHLIDKGMVASWFGSDITPMLNEIEQVRPAILIVDNLEAFASFKGEHTNESSIGTVVRFFDHLATAYNMVVVVLHHDNKSAGSGDSSNAFAGSNQIRSAARIMLHLYEDRLLGIKAIECTKNNLADDSAIPNMTFRIDPEAVPNGSFGHLPGIEWLGTNNAVSANNDVHNQEQLDAKTEQLHGEVRAIAEAALNLAATESNTATGIIEAIAKHGITKGRYYKVTQDIYPHLFHKVRGLGSTTYIEPVGDWQVLLYQMSDQHEHDLADVVSALPTLSDPASTVYVNMDMMS